MLKTILQNLYLKKDLIKSSYSIIQKINSYRKLEKKVYFDLLELFAGVVQNISEINPTGLRVGYAFNDWPKACPPSLGTFVLELLANEKKTLIGKSEYGEIEYTIEKNGITFGITLAHGEISIAAKKEQINSAKSLIYELIQQKLPKNALATIGGTQYYPKLCFDEDTLVVPIFSQITKKKANYCKKYLDKKENRTVMLYGPAGTGKSTIAKTLSKELNMNSLRLTHKAYEEFCRNSESLLKFLKPEILIVDDFDQIKITNEQLDILSAIHNHVKLTILTCNTVENFSAAVVRPGRIDEKWDILALDEISIRKTLKEHQDLFEIVKDWSISFIKEAVTRLEVEGNDKKEEIIKELQTRQEKK